MKLRNPVVTPFNYLEGALDCLVLAHVQDINELLDLGLAAGVLSLPPRQLLPLLCEVHILIQGLLVDISARTTPLACQMGPEKRWQLRKWYSGGIKRVQVVLPAASRTCSGHRVVDAPLSITIVSVNRWHLERQDGPDCDNSHAQCLNECCWAKLARKSLGRCCKTIRTKL